MSDEAVIRALTRSALSHLVGQVMKVRGLGMPAAVKTVYDSRLYGLINDPRTGLYREGPLYLYDMLNEENQTEGNDLGSGDAREVDSPRSEGTCRRTAGGPCEEGAFGR